MLLLNAGSSSLKGAVMEAAGAPVLAQAAADWAGPVTRYRVSAPANPATWREVAWRSHSEAARRMLADLPLESLAAVGHRIVHGGEFTSSVRITPAVRARIAELAAVAPLHNPPGLETLAAAEAALPDLPQVAVFDTAFHATLPAEARTYPIPAAWTRDWGLRRYGFHGLSHDYCARRAAELLGRAAEGLRLVICHLGHGCSAAAVRGGKSLDTTMGFSPLDGLMMATRSGSVDPGLLLHAQRRLGLSAEQVETALERDSGLLGVSGISADMREVQAAARGGDARARLALDVYAHRVRQAIGALAVTLGGVDALVFTAGVGENSSEVRAASCRGLECLGLELDPEANAGARPDADVARRDSPGRILVVATREEETMLREVTRVLQP
ncbi:MAG TPA: acetate/propionate family kinase [Myxococcota bacterium]|nr:acetate/propionate family kinase [Myxococcota bacterium]